MQINARLPKRTPWLRFLFPAFTSTRARVLMAETHIHIHSDSGHPCIRLCLHTHTYTLYICVCVYRARGPFGARLIWFNYYTLRDLQLSWRTVFSLYIILYICVCMMQDTRIFLSVGVHIFAREKAQESVCVYVAIFCFLLQGVDFYVSLLFFRERPWGRYYNGVGVCI